MDLRLIKICCRRAVYEAVRPRADSHYSRVKWLALVQGNGNTDELVLRPEGADGTGLTGNEPNAVEVRLAVYKQGG